MGPKYATYLVDFTFTQNGVRLMGARYVELFENYSTFADIPKMLEIQGYRELVIIKAELKN